MKKTLRCRGSNAGLLAACLVVLSCSSAQPPLKASKVSSAAQNKEETANSPARPPASKEDSQANQALTTVSVFVIHQVSDLPSFDSYFKENQEARSEAGIVGYRLSQIEESEDAPAGQTRIVAHFVAASLDKVEAFLNSDALEKLLNRKGAPESSVLWTARDLLLRHTNESSSSPTFSLFSKFSVDDVEQWKESFEEISPRLKSANVISAGVHVSTADDQVIIVHLIGTDLEKLRALTTDPETKSVLYAGAKGAPARPLLCKDLLHEGAFPSRK